MRVEEPLDAKTSRRRRGAEKHGNQVIKEREIPRFTGGERRRSGFPRSGILASGTAGAGQRNVQLERYSRLAS